MASMITYFKRGWTQIRKKRNGTTIKETGLWVNNDSTPVINQELQNSVSGVEENG